MNIYLFAFMLKKFFSHMISIKKSKTKQQNSFIFCLLFKNKHDILTILSLWS
jgi:hypothetical protein